MAITVTAGTQRRGRGTFQTATTMGGSTATGVQTISLMNDAVSIQAATGSGSTATGFSLNRFLLPTTGAVEGQYITVVGCSTMEATIVMTGTATGARVFSATGQYETYRYMNGTWRVIETSGPTIATATGTA
jgi:hypothetical protein